MDNGLIQIQSFSEGPWLHKASTWCSITCLCKASIMPTPYQPSHTHYFSYFLVPTWNHTHLLLSAFTFWIMSKIMRIYKSYTMQFSGSRYRHVRVATERAGLVVQRFSRLHNRLKTKPRVAYVIRSLDSDISLVCIQGKQEGEVGSQHRRRYMHTHTRIHTHAFSFFLS